MIDYILNNQNKKDEKFKKSVYDFCYQNDLVPQENKFLVIAHSVMEIKQAVVNCTNYSLKYEDGKYRPYVTNKENNLNSSSDAKGVILVKITGYLPKKKINLHEYDNNVITCIDNTWATFMYKDNRQRKKNLDTSADVYLLSGNYLLANPHGLETLPQYNTKISFGFFKSKTLAMSVQNQINYMSGGFILSDIDYVRNALLNPYALLSAYKLNYNVLKNGVDKVETVIKKYNDEFENCKVNYYVEPTMLYVYIKSDYINKFKKYYNTLNLEHKLYVQFQSELQSIWTPDVKNGAFIKIC
jgi:hypothetical protein